MPFVFRILPLELGENMMVPIGWTGSLSVLFMRPLVISWKEKRCLRLIAGRWRACQKITERNFVMLSSKYQKEQIELEQQN